MSSSSVPMARFRTLDDVDVKDKRVLLRVDLNVPTENGKVTDATRIERQAPTINEIADKGGKAILLSHFGRPKGPDPSQSLRPVAQEVARVLGRPVAFAEDCIGEKAAKPSRAMKSGDILLSGEHPLPQGRGEERPGVRRGAGEARRPLGQRRVFRRAPRARLDRRSRPCAAGLCRAQHAGRARRARQGARRTRSGRSPRSSAARKSPVSSTCSAT